MNDPNRSVEARLLAALEREMQRPADSAVMRDVAGRLGATLGVSLSAATAAGAAGAGSASSVSGVAPVAKGAIGLFVASHPTLAPLLVLLGSATVTGLSLFGASALSTPKAAPVAAAPTRGAIAPRATRPALTPGSNVATVEATALREPPRAPPPSRSVGALSADAPVASGSRGSQEFSLRAQQALLDTARQALARGQSSAALSALAQHAARFPRSALEEEREALTVKALRAAQRTAEANERAARFSARYPASVFSPSVTGSSIP